MHLTDGWLSSMLPSLTSPLRPSSRPRCERSPFPVESPTLESIDGAIAYGHNLSRFLQHYACVYGESQSLRLVLCTYRTSCPGLKGIHRLTQHTGTPLLWCRHTFVLHVVCVSQTFMKCMRDTTCACADFPIVCHRRPIRRSRGAVYWAACFSWCSLHWHWCARGLIWWVAGRWRKGVRVCRFFRSRYWNMFLQTWVGGCTLDRDSSGTGPLGTALGACASEMCNILHLVPYEAFWRNRGRVANTKFVRSSFPPRSLHDNNIPFWGGTCGDEVGFAPSRSVSARDLASTTNSTAYPLDSAGGLERETDRSSLNSCAALQRPCERRSSGGRRPGTRGAGGVGGRQ